MNIFWKFQEKTQKKQNTKIGYQKNGTYENRQRHTAVCAHEKRGLLHVNAAAL